MPQGTACRGDPDSRGAAHRARRRTREGPRRPPHAPLTELAAAGLQTPDTAEGHRLAAALRAYVAPAPAGASEAPSVAAPAPAAAADARVAEDADEERRDDDDGLVPGDEQDEPEGTIFPALRILKESVARSKMHPILVVRTEDREAGPCPEPCCRRLVLRPASLTTPGLPHCLSSPAHAHSRPLAHARRHRGCLADPRYEPRAERR